MYHVLEGLQDLLDGDIDETRMAQIKVQLANARKSNRADIISLTDILRGYLDREMGQLPPAKVGVWKRFTLWVDEVGNRFGRSKHRAAISFALIGWVILVVGYIVAIFQGGPNLDFQVLQWRAPLIGIQVVIGFILIVAAFFWLIKREDLGLKFGVSGFLISLVALQLLYFYISQFSALTATLLQLAILQVMFAYRRWYITCVTF
jgi:hypothetical protein